VSGGAAEGAWQCSLQVIFDSAEGLTAMAGQTFSAISILAR
jgi:hypothetical protein